MRLLVSPTMARWSMPQLASRSLRLLTNSSLAQYQGKSTARLGHRSHNTSSPLISCISFFSCLDTLRKLTEAATGCTFNFALVNYYASGDDSISYHSDDERFLGVDPAIASFSLGAKRDFLIKHKPTPQKHVSETKPMKFNLASGDMVLMRGKTQSNWLHSIPKRKGGEADKGRINITFRKAMVKGGTDNYYRYNVGDGGIYKWSEDRREMLPTSKAPDSNISPKKTAS